MGQVPLTQNVAVETAKRALKDFYGAGIEIVDNSDGHNFDLSIFRNDDFIGACEVKSDSNEDLAAQSARLRKNGMVRQRSDNNDVWVRLKPTANVKVIEKVVNFWVLRMLERGITHLVDSASFYNFFADDYEKYSDLNIQLLTVQPASGSGQTVFIQESMSGQLEISDREIHRWLDALLVKHATKNSISLIGESLAKEKHLFIQVGTATPGSLLLAWSEYSSAMPQFDVELPEGLTHLWVGGIRGFYCQSFHNRLFVKGRGWEVHNEGENGNCMSVSL